MYTFSLPAAEVGSIIRLADGSAPNEGRVEVLGPDGQWGTICDNGWSAEDAQVVCRQLGYPAASFYTSDAFFGSRPELPVLLENIHCVGREYQKLYLICCLGHSIADFSNKLLFREALVANNIIII